MAGAVFLMGRRDQFMQDAAFARAAMLVALGAQGNQLPFQRLYAAQALADTAELIVDQLVDVAAIGLQMRDEIEQSLDVGQRHVEFAAMPDERERL